MPSIPSLSTNLVRPKGERIGFLVSALGATQLGYHLLEQGNAVLGKTLDLDVIVFFQNVVKTWTTPTFAMMNVSEAFSFSGTVIATDVETTNKCRQFPGPRARFFYVWDLEWLRPSVRTYEDYNSVYNDPSIPLIARSDSHAGLIERCWNRKVLAVVPNCSLGQMSKAISKYEKRP